MKVLTTHFRAKRRGANHPMVPATTYSAVMTWFTQPNETPSFSKLVRTQKLDGEITALLHATTLRVACTAPIPRKRASAWFQKSGCEKKSIATIIGPFIQTAKCSIGHSVSNANSAITATKTISYRRSVQPGDMLHPLLRLQLQQLLLHPSSPLLLHVMKASACRSWKKPKKKSRLRPPSSGRPGAAAHPAASSTTKCSKVSINILPGFINVHLDPQVTITPTGDNHVAGYHRLSGVREGVLVISKRFW